MNKPPDFKGWAVFALGLFFILFGLPMVIGGSWLVILGGSWYDLPAEIGTPNNGGSVITAGGSGSQNITSFLSREKGYAFRAILGLA